MSAHQHLRDATQAAHDRVDARFSTFDLADARQYSDFLLAHASAFIPAEQAIVDAGGDSIPGFLESRRSDALLKDLSDLGLKLPQTKAFDAFQTWPKVLGCAYVLEGSRLGGAVMERLVGSDLPRRFLGARPPAGHWRAFIAFLDQQLADERAIADASHSALGTFALFETTAISVCA